MKNIVHLLSQTVSLYLSVLFLLLMLRMIISLFVTESSSKPVLFIYSATEPVILPVRSFLMRFEFFQSLPVDFSVTITVFILWFVTMFL